MAPVIASTNVATNQTNNKSSNKNKKKNKNKNKNPANVVLVSNDGDNNLPPSSDNHQSKSSSSPSPSSPPPSKQNNNNGKSLKSNAKSSSSDDHLKRKNLDHLLLGGSNKKQKNYDDKHAENYSLQTKRQSSVDSEVDNNDKLSSIDNEWNSPILSQFVWLMSGIYFFAFTSFYYQIRGLYGENGVLPLRYYATTFALKNESLTFQSLFVRSPSLVWPIAAAGFSLTTALELVTIFGVILSVVQLFFASFRIAPYYFLQFVLYYSVLKTGQRFMSFQWDYFLLETGALAIIASASTIDRTSSAFLHRLTPHPKLLRWPLRWLMFRFMFANGVVKLTSRCPLWWSLRSLDVHFESQCLPTPIAWYAHHLPQNWLHLATALTFVLEIVLPFFFFTPFTSLKIFSFAIQVFFQLSIIATGNYNFFNLLTIVLSLALLDDDIFFVAVNKPKQKSGSGCFVRKIMESLFVGVITAILAHYTIHYFNISFDESQSFWQGPNTSINFTYEDFNYFLTQAITVAIWLGAASFSLIAIYSLYKSISSPGTILGGTVHLVSTLFYVVTIGYIFSISLVPLAELDTTGSYLRQLPTSVKNWYSASQDLHLVSDYGLFRSMTGEGGRPELIVEGTDDPNSSTWKPYHFQYKPGDLATAPQFNFPHQPRLDWQMWFAALGTYQQNPWLLNFCYRLLTSEPDVLNLLDRSRLPFTTQPPKYLRISRYLYKYTDNFADTAWWRRVSNRHAYLPVVNKESLAEVLKLSQIQLPKVISESGDTRAPFLKTVLDQLYLSFVLKTIPHYVMYTVFLVAILFKVRLWESQRQQLVGNSRSN